MYIDIDEDDSFDRISEESTNEEIIDSILNRLYKSCKTEYVSDWKMKYLHENRIINIVDEMLEADVVEVADIVYGTSNYPLKITRNGKRIMEEKGGWLSYKTLEKRKKQSKLIVQACENILFSIYDDGYISISKDTEELFREIDRLLAEGLIYESQKYVYKLTGEGIKAVEIGGYKEWLNQRSKEESFLNNKSNNNFMNPALRLETIRKIADSLAVYNVTDINSILKGYNFNDGLQPSASSKRNYVTNILSRSNDNLILLLMAKDLGLSVPNAENIKQEVKQSNTKQTSMKANKIFLSHASKDKEVVNVFLEFLEDIGVDDEKQVFYSSKSWTGVKIGQDFLDRIKSEINEDTIVISFLSENFYQSPVSLCEMGAAWVKTEKTQALLIPPFNYSDIKGVLKQTIITMKLDDDFKYRITELKEYIENEMGLTPINNLKWEQKREKLLREFAAAIDIVNERSK